MDGAVGGNLYNGSGIILQVTSKLGLFFALPSILTVFHIATCQLYFNPRDAMLARVIVIATCPSVCLSRAGIVSKRRKLAA